MLSETELDTVSWMANILSESMDRTLLIGKDLFQRIPMPPQPLVKRDSSSSLLSETPVPV